MSSEVVEVRTGTAFNYIRMIYIFCLHTKLHFRNLVSNMGFTFFPASIIHIGQYNSSITSFWIETADVCLMDLKESGVCINLSPSHHFWYVFRDGIKSILMDAFFASETLWTSRGLQFWYHFHPALWSSGDTQGLRWELIKLNSSCFGK